jgi:hypothetical protein
MYSYVLKLNNDDDVAFRISYKLNLFEAPYKVQLSCLQFRFHFHEFVICTMTRSIHFIILKSATIMQKSRANTPKRFSNLYSTEIAELAHCLQGKNKQVMWKLFFKITSHTNKKSPSGQDYV